MSPQTVTVQISSQLYEQVQQMAQRKNRSVEEEIASAIEATLASDEWVGIPIDLAEEAAQLPFLDDEQLQRVANTTISAEKSERMQILSWKRQSEGLTETEREEAQQLQRHAQRIILLRAEAAALLNERGLDIDTLRQPQST